MGNKHVLINLVISTAVGLVLIALGYAFHFSFTGDTLLVLNVVWSAVILLASLWSGKRSLWLLLALSFGAQVFLLLGMVGTRGGSLPLFVGANAATSVGLLWANGWGVKGVLAAVRPALFTFLPGMVFAAPDPVTARWYLGFVLFSIVLLWATRKTVIGSGNPE